MLLAHVAAQHARVCSGRPRMPLAMIQDAVARNHGHRIGDRQPHHLFRDRMNRHHPALPAMARERLGRQPLARQRPLQVAEADAALFRLPAFIENRRAEVGHARRVRIHLRGYVQSAAPRACDHLQAQRRFPQTHAGNVYHVQRRARRRRIGDHFLQRIDHARLQRTSVPYVNVERRLPLGRQAEQFQNLGAGCQGHISDPHADAQRTFVQAAAHQVEGLAALLGSGGAFRGVVRQQRAAIVHHRHARGDVPGGGAEVDQRLAFARAIPFRHRRNSHFHFERGGHPVPGFEAVVLRRLPVRVQVDEARRDH